MNWCSTSVIVEVRLQLRTSKLLQLQRPGSLAVKNKQRDRANSEHESLYTYLLTGGTLIGVETFDMDIMNKFWIDVLAFATASEPRPGLHPIPGTKSITLEALVLPPVIYYIALLFLPPPPPTAIDTTSVKLLRHALAAAACVLFFRLPLCYYIPQSVGLNYQLSFVGLYGGCRVLDACFISPLLFNHIPRRVRYEHRSLSESSPITRATAAENAEGTHVDSKSASAVWERLPSLPLDNYLPDTAGDAVDSAMGLLSKTITGPSKQHVFQFETSEDGWPHTFLDRASWALELELSMRGMGFTWTTADVRHTKRTWLPTVTNRLHSIFVHVLPVMAICLFVIRSTYDKFLASEGEQSLESPSQFDARLSLIRQLKLTAALGAFLMVAFSLAHSMAAILCAPLAPSPFAFFPPLYTTPVWEVYSVRQFWSHGWHRLFARLFLIYGVWPGEWVERTLTGKRSDQPADIGKVIGGFVSSAFVHSFSVRSVLGGDWTRARGEGIFFLSNGLAILLEEAVVRFVLSRRKQVGQPLQMWYDSWIGRAWWVGVLLFSGRNFARGWVDAGLVREMAGR
nr:o-mevalon transferase yani [Quercus suber]